MMKTLLVRGMLAGLIAGVLAFGFAYAFGEPSVNAAIGLEEPGGHAHSHDTGTAPSADAHEEELVPRDVQSTAGLLTGVLVYGVAIGGLLSLAFAFAQGRLGSLRPRVTALLLTSGAFAVVFLVPFLKYPANPPAVGQAGTIGARTELYFGFVAVSLLVGIFATVSGRKLAGRFGAWNGFLLAAAGYLAVIGVVAWLLPAVDEVPAGFPASTLWSFRTASVGTQVTLWLALGLTFGVFAEKALTRKTAVAA
ncbi:CbtA family protein [Amycolatopsis australiensis]|uniref:Probable cobalt transporter subunit (CbtA) n=1 Tax=Amycolatopsis australiensis TaxID=546364 RepID=A0A1K1RHG6_9PSEU|nr:CbtA family protein [Amycolatopsis australiensis]SFW71385.1 Probable cobalt transporter subunit (CbtA) [Amycolatopsis australiensis]